MKVKLRCRKAEEYSAATFAAHRQCRKVIGSYKSTKSSAGYIQRPKKMLEKDQSVP